jgi:aspartate aminotransferase
MGISKLASSIQESPTLKLNEAARLLRVKGEPVIHLGGGEPKNKAPITAILGSAAKLNAGDVKYAPTDGLPSLKKAIIRYTEENYGRLVAPENVIVSTGAKQSIFNVLYTLIDPQDEVVIFAPYWVSYPDMIKMVYGIPVVVTPEDGSFQPRMQEVEQAVSSYTKAMIVNSPNNPSGVAYSAEFIAELVEYCERKGIYLIMDDIYHRLVFDDNRPPSAYEFTDQDVENTRVIVINGVSKLYGMTGFRIGWAIANRRMVGVMANVQSQITSCPSVVSQAAAEGALTGTQSLVENLRLTIQNNRDIMLGELSAFSDVSVTKPNGTFYCLPDFRAYGNDSMKLAQFLLEKALVVTVRLEGKQRLSYRGSAKDISPGVARRTWALDPNAPNEIYIGDRKLIRDWL